MPIPLKKLSFGFLLLLALSGLIKAQDTTQHIFAGKLLDVEDGIFLENVVITVENGMILEIREDVENNSFEYATDLSATTDGKVYKSDL